MSPEDVCVYCRRRPVDPAWRPFCSERCQLLDLGEWVDERYRIPGGTVDVGGERNTEDSDDSNED